MTQPKKPAAKKRAAPQQKYIRNIRYVSVSVRLETGRRIELRPRGERGDTAPVSSAETKDNLFVANKDLIFEVITANEANNVIEKQKINQQITHPALSQMRNAKGEEYTKGVVVQDNIEVQGSKVGDVDERGMITRFTGVGTTDNPIRVEQDTSSLQKQDEAVREALKKEGPESGLGGLKVTKDDVQNT